MSPSSLPPYLTSGASSRAHHAFLVKVHSAASEQEEDEIIRDQVRKAKEVLIIGQSTSKILETLIILLHCQAIRHDTSYDLDFALLPALGLAEGGKTVYERRIGYLYLTECLPRDHELRLMLINTIRKDLSSINPQHILLALHAIIHLPSHDLEPAVTPLLTSKTLLRHTNEAVRQRALQALQVLHLQDESMSLSRTIGPHTFPLDMRKIVKLLEQEEDASVQQSLLALIQRLIKSGVHRVKDDNERQFLAEQIIGSMTDGEIGPLAPTGVEALVDIIFSSSATHGPSDQVSKPVFEWIDTTLAEVTLPSKWENGLLLEICRLVSRFSSEQIPSITTGHLMRILTGMLSTRDSGSTPTPPASNDHVLILRCLAVLPTGMWAESLSENEMGTIMEGLNHADATIRRLTLRLLDRLSPDLPRASYTNHLQAIRSSTDLALPLGYSNDNPAAKLRAAQEETALRALEAAEVILGLDEDTLKAGEVFGQSVGEVFEVLSEAQDRERRRIIWEQGVRVVLEILDNAQRESQEAMGRVMAGQRSSAATLRVVQATVVSKYCKLSPEETLNALSILTHDMTGTSNSVQELLIIAGLVICGQLRPVARDAPLDALNQSLRDLENGSKYIRKRIKQIDDIIEKGLIDKVVLDAGSNSLPDVLQRIIALTSRLKPSSDLSPVQPPAAPSTSTTTLASSPSLSLRYEPYDLPQSSPRSRLVGSPNSPARGSQPRPPRHRDDFTSAGDFTLFDADADAEGDADVESVDMSMGSPPSPQDNDPTLVSLSLDESPRRIPLSRSLRNGAPRYSR